MIYNIEVHTSSNHAAWRFYFRPLMGGMDRKVALLLLDV